MNILLSIGLLLISGYVVGWVFGKMGLPKILGYIITGIALSPNNLDFIQPDIIQFTNPLMKICLAFIAFEVGGALKWSKLKSHGKDIISITVLASVLPFALITVSIVGLKFLFPTMIPFSPNETLLFALFLGVLASPTDAAATLAVMHEYKAKGKVTDTILGIAALDDVLGILLFSLTLGSVSLLTVSNVMSISEAIYSLIYEIGGALLLGGAIAWVLHIIDHIFKIKGEGKWIVVIISLIILCAGIAEWAHIDQLLSYMTMGAVLVNLNRQHEVIFKILERYTEDLVFLFFFLLSGLLLDLSVIPESAIMILIFVALRTIGKIYGATVGGMITGAEKPIRKYTGGGLIPQAGIVIGLVLIIYQREEFSAFSGILLTTIMGATVVHEIIGPIAAKYFLSKAGEIKDQKED